MSRSVSGPLQLHSLFAALFSCAALMLAFPAIQAAEVVLGKVGGVQNVYWSVYYSVLMLVCLVFPRIAWHWLSSESTHISKMLEGSPASKEYTSTIKRYLDKMAQTVTSCVGGLASSGLLYIISKEFSAGMTFVYSSYVQVFIVGALVANAVYWMILVPSLIRVIRPYELNRNLLEPSKTQGVQSLSMVLSKSALLSVVSLVMSVAPLYYYNVVLGSQTLGYVANAVASSGLLIVLYILMAPQVWLRDIVACRKERCLSEIDMYIRNYYRDEGAKYNVEAAIGIYNIVRSSGTWVIDIHGIANYLSLISTGLSPFIIKWMLG